MYFQFNCSSASGYYGMSCAFGVWIGSRVDCGVERFQGGLGALNLG